ncbi:hypothetical protein C8J57DRAFT_1230194 [Mycena rebaudengoi]|nr:hypothetical protein C8J57DRAFT_1230194 [Mycena rebaudengoi]
MARSRVVVTVSHSSHLPGLALQFHVAPIMPEFTAVSRDSSPPRALSSPSSAMSERDVIEINDSGSDSLALLDTCGEALLVSKVENPSVHLPTTPPTESADPKATKRKGKKKAMASPQNRITRQEKVDEIINCTTIPSTFDVPSTPIALLVDLSASAALFTKPDGRLIPVATHIRSELQSYLFLGSGHTRGDADVRGFTFDLTETIRANASLLVLKGSRQMMRKCKKHWNHELEKNEEEAASATYYRSGSVAFFGHCVTIEPFAGRDPSYMRSSFGYPKWGNMWV